MHAAPDIRLVWLYQVAEICQAFPAYRIEDIRQMSGSQLRDVMTAMQLLSTARQVNND